MRVDHRDKKLEAMEKTRQSKHYSEATAKKYLKAMTAIRAADSENDLRQMVSLGYHNLKGDRSGQRGMTLTANERLVVEPALDEHGQLMMIIEIVDYH